MITIISKNVNFSKWYDSVLLHSNLCTHGLVKGTVLLHPKACYLWEKIQHFMNYEFSTKNIENVMFPAFLPCDELEKEKEKLNGFAPELFLVSSSGQTESSKIFLRPTSEILFCHYFKKKLESYEDLPLLLNQWCAVYRSEKNTKLFLRSCEFYWQEAHTLHLTQQEALKFLDFFHASYLKLVRDLLGIDVLSGEKTILERFQGSNKTLTIEGIMPDGQVLQMATSHYLEQNFTSVFDVKYTDKNNKKQYPHQLSAGCSTRLLGALVMSHSDDSGLVLPWDLSKIKINILVLNDAVIFEDNFYNMISEIVMDYEVFWNFSPKTFGQKINDSEINGVPIAIVIGHEEVKNNIVVLKSRIENEKIKINISELKNKLLEKKRCFNEILFKKNHENLQSHIVEANTLEELLKIIEDKKVGLMPWFDDAVNENNFKNQNYGFGPRCIPKRINDFDEKKYKNLKCFFSGELANCLAYFGRSY